MIESIQEALRLLTSFDAAVWQTIWVSLYTTLCAITLASILAIPAGLIIGTSRFVGRRILIIALNTLIAMPTVVIGLVGFMLLSRHGWFGSFGLLFTPWGMIIGQTMLAIPIVAHYTLSAAAGADPRILRTAHTLGCNPTQVLAIVMAEIRFGIVAALVAGFGRVIAEVGIAMMLGGNIRGLTRTMTTAIALETSKGEFAFGLALGMVLMLVALTVNLVLNLVQQKVAWQKTGAR